MWQDNPKTLSFSVLQILFLIIYAEGVGIEPLCADVAHLVENGERMVLVHGGSHETNVISEQLGKPPRFATTMAKISSVSRSV